MRIVRILTIIALALAVSCSKKSTDASNHSPVVPSDLRADKHTGQTLTYMLTWNCSDPDDDSVTFEVYFGTSSLPHLEKSNHAQNSYTVDSLDYNTKYYWKIVARDIHGATSSSSVTNFTTESVSTPICSISPTGLNFGNIEVGQSKDSSFAISNSGVGTLSGTIGESCGDYSIVSGGGSYGLGAGESRTVRVRFSPSSSGAKSCTIGMGSITCSDLSCTGNGVEPPPNCSISTTILEYSYVEVGQYKDLSFAITNTGGGILSGSWTWLHEPHDSSFSIVSGRDFSLGAGQSQTVTVRFSPTSPGVHTFRIVTGILECEVPGVGDGREFLAIASEENAKDVFQAIYQIAHNMDKDSVSLGNHAGTIITGDQGTASITGEKSVENGSDDFSVWEHDKSDYTIGFNAYKSGSVTLSGSVKFYKYFSSKQYYSGYYSDDLSYWIDCDSLGIELNEYVAHFSSVNYLDLVDKVSIGSRGLNDSEYRFEVTLTTNSGVVYKFEDWF